MHAKHARPAPPEKARIEDLLSLCEARGVALSGPRRVVLETVLTLDTHPTADEVHAAAVRREEGIGRATVYRALDAFVAGGILTKALHPGAAVRYDVRAQRHHHLVCVRCEGIIDITDEELDALPVPDTSNLGFEITDVQVQMRGVCRACRKKENRS